MQIHELPTGNIEDGNKLPFDTGTNTYATSFTALANAVVNKTFSALTTTAKTLPGAINELNTKQLKRMAATATTNANGAINLTNLTGLSWWVSPIVQVVVRTANANLVCFLTVTQSNTIWCTVKYTDGNVLANTEVSLAIVYCEF